MAENKLKIQHLRSKELVNGKPKLPTDLDEGEIAINFATGHETIAIKNDGNQIVKFDNKVDENYEPTQYNGNFETLVTETNHVKAGDTNSKAFKSVENTMSTLVDEVYKNEKAIVTTFGTVGSATGIVDAEGNISYQTKADAHYIAPATSVHDATVLLDNSLKGVDDKNSTDINKLAESAGIKRNVETEAFDYQKETGAHYIQNATSVHDATVKLDFRLGQTTDTSDHNVQDIKDLALVAGAVKNGAGSYVYQEDSNTKYIGGATSVHNATVLLDSSLSRNQNNIENLAKSTGIKLNENIHTYEYTQEEGANYISDATSVHDATVKLDFRLGEIDYAFTQRCPISLDFAELNGVKWLTFDFNDFIGNIYHWGSLGDETKSPFPRRTTADWDAIKNIVAPLSSDENTYDRNRVLSPAFDIIYHLTNGHARIAREDEYSKLNSFDHKNFSPGLMGQPGTWVCTNNNHIVNFVAGYYKTAEIGARVKVNNGSGIMIYNESSDEQEGRIMGVLIK